ELLGIYDTDMIKATEKSEEFNTRHFEELDDLLEKTEAVSLVVPTSFHFSEAEKIIKKGVNLLIEKPITQTVDQAEKLIQMAQEKNLTLQVGHIERFNPAFTAVQSMNLDPKFIESHRLAPFVPRGTDVAVILDLMVHDIDLILTLVKDKVKTIEAAGISVISDSEDIANARITFEKGCVANVTTSRISARPMRKLRLFQKDTYISMDFLKKKTEVYRLVESDKVKQQGKTVIGNIPLDKGKTILYEIPPVKDEDMLTLELKSFLGAVKDKKRPIVSGEDGKEALRVALEIVKKVKEHKKNIR
ncbi:MAG: Gfo/Idh/MocA family oxidoreductase, partial [Candidatus Zixiibacteriota bacterium]